MDHAGTAVVPEPAVSSIGDLKGTGSHPDTVRATLTVRQRAAGHGNVEPFSGLDLVVAPGDVIGRVGPNGAGVSTLLRMMAGARRPGARHGVAEPADRDGRLVPS
jgi:ABC-type glutathione transport system ATPase component